jgi:agmatine/peptidylarginine deiminase
VSSDERAFAILREALSGRDVVAIPSEDLIVGLGAVHCLTQSEPR